MSPLPCDRSAGRLHHPGAAVAEDWADWFDFIRAFVAAYAPEETEELDSDATHLMSDEVSATVRSGLF